MKYMLFYTGLASDPWSVGLKCLTTNEIICEIGIDFPTSIAGRERYEKLISLLRKKYSSILN